MTTNIPDLSHLQTLELYTVGEILELETGESRLLWFHRMAKNGLLTCYQKKIAWPADAMLEKLATKFVSLSEDRYFVEAIDPNYRRDNRQSILKKISIREAFEGVEIDKDVFKTWCSVSRYRLPCFWFGGQEKTEATNAGAALADVRHGKKRPPSSAVELIIKRIRDKESRREYWHQAIEVDSWLSENPKSAVSKKLFIAAVKRALPSGIEAKGHAPRKK